MKKIQKNAARFDNLKQDFLDDKKYSGTAEATLNGYRYDITRFLKFLSDEQLTVNEAGFKRYVIHLTDSGMTANSVNHYIRLVKVFLYWCMEQNEITPFKIKMVKAQETIKDVYTQEELCALIQPPKREDSFVVWRSWAIINFILGTAAREATVCEMQISLFAFLIRISIAAMGAFPKNQNAKFGNPDSKISENQKSTLSGAMVYCCSFNSRLYLK